MIISSGNYLINGFNNKNIRKKYFEEDNDKQSNINRMTRLFSKLRAHGIMKKIPRKTNII